jgi:hypothetical protein
VIPKLISSQSFNFDAPVASLVPLHGNHVGLTKHANHGVFTKYLKDFKAPPNKTVIHVLAVGDEEMYGPNRNGDGFSREDNRTAHRSFVDIGHVFKNHQNDDPFKSVGDVVQSGHHDLMSRIELLLGLDNDKCRREIQALHEGKDIPVSMGSMQDYDVCSICGHQAPTAADHCFHITDLLGQILSDGRRVYMKNPKPKYFDISIVFKPADRIAYALRKVAEAHGRVIGGHELAELVGMGSWANPKFATLKALAAFAKRVPAKLTAAAPKKLTTASVKELRKIAELHGIEQLIGFLNANGWLLGPSDFGEVIGHPNPAGCEAAANEFGSLDALLDDHTQVAALEPPGAQESLKISPDTVSDLRRQTSMDPGATQARVIQITIQQPVSKTAAIMDPTEAQGFALLYGHYKVAFAHVHYGRQDVLRTVAVTF